MQQINITDLEKIILTKNHDEILMDVRTPAEHAEGHIPGFENFPLETLKKNLNNFRNKKIIVACKSGARAKKAAEILKDIADVQCYAGSFEEWKSENKEIIKLKTGRFTLPIDRQLFLLIGIVLIVSFFTPYGPWITLFVGSGLTFAALTGICFLHMALSKMPWNTK